MRVAPATFVWIASLPLAMTAAGATKPIAAVMARERSDEAIQTRAVAASPGSPHCQSR
jgi:hypothetical protein